MRVVINGFGRIGRQFFQAALEQKLPVEFVAINGVSNPENAVYLLKYDTVYGKSKFNFHVEKGHIVVGKHRIKVLNERNPKKLPWKKLKVDLVIESTGKFRSKELSMQHITAGAKRVLISATAKNIDVLIVPGVNGKSLKKSHKIISMASCTTNCVVQMLSVIDSNFGIKEGFMLTTHSYTSTQRLVDGNNKDFRRGRSAAQNIVPTSTSAADAAAKVLPQLKGKINGYALRVPVVNGSIVDLTLEIKKKTTPEKINNVFKKAAAGRLKGILGYTSDPIVSSDILKDPRSCIFDSLLTKVQGDMVNVVGWYDNEWGYSSRLVDTVRAIKKL